MHDKIVNNIVISRIVNVHDGSMFGNQCVYKIKLSSRRFPITPSELPSNLERFERRVCALNTRHSLITLNAPHKDIFCND